MWVTGVAVTPDGSRAVSASADKTLKVWDLGRQCGPGGGVHCNLDGPHGSGNGVAVTPDGSRAVSASHDHTLKVWDLASGQELRTLKGHTAWSAAWR